MALPTVTKTYVYNVNNADTGAVTVDATYKNMWYAWKSALVGGGWTVRSSSNASSASASDLWTSPAAIIGPPGAGLAHSWIVLRHPVCAWDICLDFNTVGPLLYRGQVAVSRGGYATTGLVTTSRPTTLLSDEQVLLNNSSTDWCFGNNNPPYVWHYVRSTDGDVQRFMLYVADQAVFAMFFDVPQDYIPGWNTSGTPGAVMCLTAVGGVVSNCISTVTYTGTPYVTRMGSGAGAAIGLYMSGDSYNGNLLCNGLAIPNDVTGEYPFVSINYVSTTAPYRGKVASPYDLWFGVSNLVAGTTYPADTSRQFAQFGSLIIPWNGTVPVTR